MKKVGEGFEVVGYMLTLAYFRPATNKEPTEP